MARQSTVPAAAGPPLARLYEQAGLPAWGLPRELAAVYGGDLGFTEPCVYANFVASVDGVTALGPEYPSSGSVISGHDPADRFGLAEWLLILSSQVQLRPAGVTGRKRSAGAQKPPPSGAVSGSSTMTYQLWIWPGHLLS
jgi:hypothetical protein